MIAKRPESAAPERDERARYQLDGHLHDGVRGRLISGLMVCVQLAALGMIASVLVGFSAWKFRGQLS